MGPLPKKRHSHSRTHRRRAHDSLSLKHLVKCENCGAYHVAHHVCAKCGTYKGQVVMEVDDSN
ncbi:MAG: 50S ribosomal protein L32 [bacterium]|nr:50S ribosomal protein L32 [bacterium]